MDSQTIIEATKTATSHFWQNLGLNEVWGVLVVAFFLLFLLSAVISRYQEGLWLNRLRKRNILTPPEQRFYRVLKTALPDKVILAQVSYNALITAKSRNVRARFNRLYADFVICNPQDFSVVAIVELDDPTHRTEEGKMKDKKRDKMLNKVGYKTARFDVSVKLSQEEIASRIMS